MKYSALLLAVSTVMLAACQSNPPAPPPPPPVVAPPPPPVKLLETCTQAFGSATLVEDQDSEWWKRFKQTGLHSTLSVSHALLEKSGCFTLTDKSDQTKKNRKTKTKTATDFTIETSVLLMPKLVDKKADGTHFDQAFVKLTITDTRTGSVMSTIASADKGIDFDFYELYRGDEKIRLAWNNWFEGEIQGTAEMLNKQSQQFKIDLQTGKSLSGDPVTLWNGTGGLVGYFQELSFWHLL